MKRAMSATIHDMPDPVMLHVRDADPAGPNTALVNLFDYAGEMLNTSIDRDRLEYNSGKLQPNQKPDEVPGIDLAPDAVVRQIETCGAWMVLKNVETIPEYLKRHTETIVSLAIFDFDIYKPTKAALQAIKPHLMKGSILVFDELCDDIFPGETLAVQEVLGLNNMRVKRMPMTARISYMEVE